MSVAPLRKVAVIGSGIMGTSIAYQLQRSGRCQVSILRPVGRPYPATHTSFGWINSFGKDPQPYYHLSKEGLNSWKRLNEQVNNKLPLKTNGTLFLASKLESAETISNRLQVLREWGTTEFKELSKAELLALESGLDPTKLDSIQYAVHLLNEGCVDATTACHVLLQASKDLGAKVLDAYALRLSIDDSGVCTGVYCTRGTGLNDPYTEPSGVDECDTWKETFEPADTVVLAAGLGITELADEAGINLPLKGYTDGEWNRIRGVVAESEPNQKLILPYTVNLVDEPLFFHQFTNGTVKACLDFNGSPVEDMTKTQGMLDTVVEYVPGFEDLPLKETFIGLRVYPVDGFPVLGEPANTPNLYVAYANGGVTLAPYFAEIATKEILDGATHDFLSEYRPTRFKGNNKRTKRKKKVVEEDEEEKVVPKVVKKTRKSKAEKDEEAAEKEAKKKEKEDKEDKEDEEGEGKGEEAEGEEKVTKKEAKPKKEKVVKEKEPKKEKVVKEKEPKEEKEKKTRAPRKKKGDVDSTE